MTARGKRSGDGGGSDGGSPAASTGVKRDVSGRVQKGPFVTGTSITISELDDTLAQTGRTFVATIDNNSGSFAVKGVKLGSAYARLAADGYYYNEVLGKLSDARLVIFTYTELTDARSVNVNLLGQLEAGRIEYLVTNDGRTFAAARAQAQEEVLAIFTFDGTGVGDAESLDIAADGAGNAKLLAISVILQGTRSVAELTELLTNIQTDIRTDGRLDGRDLGSALMNGARTVDPAKLRAGLKTRFDAVGVSATIPDFESYLQRFIDNAPYAFTGGIQYPTVGSRPNVLAKDILWYPSGGYPPLLGFAATLPPSTELKVRLTRTSGTQPGDAWGYAGINGLNWSVTLWDGTGSGPQEFTAAHDGALDVEVFSFGGTGAATIDYFEYGATAPTFSKNITWSPTAPSLSDTDGGTSH